MVDALGACSSSAAWSIDAARLARCSAAANAELTRVVPAGDSTLDMGVEVPSHSKSCQGYGLRPPRRGESCTRGATQPVESFPHLCNQTLVVSLVVLRS